MRTALLVAIALVVGCGKKPKDSDADGSGYVAPVAATKSGAKGDDAPNAVWESQGVRVRLAKAERLNMKGYEVLNVALWVNTVSADKRITFRSWAGSSVRLHDDKGNDYASREGDPVVKVVRQQLSQDVTKPFGSGPADADRTRVDLLYFDPPVRGAGHLDLVLPAQNVGLTGEIHLRVLRAAWESPRK